MGLVTSMKGWRRSLGLSLCVLAAASATTQARTLIDLGLGKAEDINNLNQVVGDHTYTEYTFPIGFPQYRDRGFLWQNGVRVDIGSLAGTSTAWCAAFDINDLGQIVGESRRADGQLHGFMWQNGAMTDLGTLYGTTSRAFGINNLGQVVGRSDTSDGGQRAYLWQNGTLTDLGLLAGHFKSEGRAINDAGLIAGYSEAVDTDFHAVLWQNGSIIDIGTFGGLSSAESLSVNELGQVAGFAPDASENPRAFLWQNGEMTDLGTLAGSNTARAFDINESGVIVGDSGGKAVVWANGSIIDLNGYLSPGSGWVLTSALSINDLGWICGQGTYNGASHAFVLVPEPASLSLLAIGVVGLMLRKSSR